jgi:hypothetical protein
MSTSMMALPIDYPVMYATRAEWSMLPPETYAKYASVTVRLLNCRTSFQANSSGIQTATQNNQLYINFAKGVEHDYPAVVKNYGGAAEPAKVTDIESITEGDHPELQKKKKKVWGTTQPSIEGGDEYQVYVVFSKSGNDT